MPLARATKAIRGLYLVTPDGLSTEELRTRVDKLFQAGVRLLQYRRKLLPKGAQRNEAAKILTLANRYGATFIINDDLALAHAIGAHGVHWGRDDAPTELPALRERIAAARASGGAANEFLVGVSCYDDYHRAEIAAAAGASYVAFGSCFPSKTKPGAVVAALSLLQQSKAALGLPVVAIGGITRDNASCAISAGADAVAVITDVFDAQTSADTVVRARQIANLFPAPLDPLSNFAGSTEPSH